MCENQVNQFKKKLWENYSNPTGWRKSAQELKQAADLLLKDMNSRKITLSTNSGLKDRDLYPVYIMLLGMAIENLLKGILIARDSAWRSGGRLNEIIGYHDLVKLVEAENTDQSPPCWLKKLTDFIKYAGRYPTPKSDKIDETYQLYLPIEIISPAQEFYGQLLGKINQIIENKRCPDSWLNGVDRASPHSSPSE